MKRKRVGGVRYVDYQFQLFQAMVKYRKTIRVIRWLSRGLCFLLLGIFLLGVSHKRLPDISEAFLWGLFVAWCVLLFLLIILLLSLYFLQTKFNYHQPQLKLEYLYLQIKCNEKPQVLGPLLLIGAREDALVVQRPGSQAGWEEISLTPNSRWMTRTVEEVLVWRKSSLIKNKVRN